MIVRRPWFAAIALLLTWLFHAGCSDRAGAQLGAETDDPYYVQGVQLKRQGRNPEALTSFLKVIDKRADRGAPESHLQAGEIFLNHMKEPAFAYYHFRRYLELQPNSSQAELVRGMVGAALREFAKTVPGRPTEDQSVRLKANEEISKLQREVEELRAELTVVRGGGTTPLTRAPRVIALPGDAVGKASTVPTARVVDSPITAAPGRGGSNAFSPVQPAAAAANITPAPRGAGAAGRTSVPPVAPAGNSAARAGLTHTVKPRESLYRISKQYNVKLEDLAAANGIRNPSNVPVGTVLRIPAAPSR